MDEHRALEDRLEDLARDMAYPPTPDIARGVAKRLGEGAGWRARRGLAWGMAVLALVLAILFAVPGVRAEILRLLQVGVVQILLSDPTPVDIPSATAARPTASPESAASATPAYTTSLLSLDGETSLEAAAQAAGFPLLLPGYPPDLGAPDRVFLQETGPVVVLVWFEPGQEERVRMSLHAIGPEPIVLRKHQPQIVQETKVNGGYAVWTEGPYMLEVASDIYSYFRLVEGHTLIWDEGEITYRLESALPLEEAVRVAESLQ